MVLFAIVAFVVSLLLIVLLFWANLREERTGRYFAPEWRMAADSEALRLKELLDAADVDLRKVPPLLSHLAHVALHFAALEFAKAARSASRRAHALADFVSHKRNFERRETRSEFLRKMTELKNSNGQESTERVEF